MDGSSDGRQFDKYAVEFDRTKTSAGGGDGVDICVIGKKRRHWDDREKKKPPVILLRMDEIAPKYAVQKRRTSSQQN